MMKTRHWSLVILLACLFLSCRKQEAGVAEESGNAGLSDSIRYAAHFRIETHAGYILATVRNPWNTGKILQRYVLVPKTAALPDPLPEGVLIRTPLERTISYGSVQCSFFREFGALQTLAGV
ncbi:MAG: hypothetical protein LBC19_09900 [Tannerella sp.]|jgi:iron complex transport system substrate-binding protein|nr:hypothetical protein [Tannerella sp.]